MVFPKEHIEHEFAKGLKRYMQEDDDEQVLSHAYEQGRESLKDGWGELDVINMYHQSLNLLKEEDIDVRDPEVMNRASHFLAEWLAPYEIRLSGYKDLIEERNEQSELLEEEVKYRQRAEELLKKNKHYFQSLIENAQDIITVLDQKKRIQYVSPSVRRMLGYKQDDLTGRDAFRYFHPDDTETVRAMLKKLVRKKGQTASAEFRFKHKNDGWIYLESVAKRIDANPDGPIIVVNSRDVTKRKRAMGDLKEKSAQLMEAQRIAKVGSWKWIPGDENGLEWSKEMCRIYGVNPQKFDHAFESFSSKIHPDDKEWVQEKIERSLETGKSFKFQHKIISADNEEKMVLCRGHIQKNNAGKIAMIGTGQDITEQKRNEQKLREYSELLRRLSGRIEDAREEERISVARQIHDELGQMLSVLKMDISLLFGSFDEKIAPGDKQELQDETHGVIDRINKILLSVQRITTELRPEVLDDLGLKEALDWQAKQFGERTGIGISFSAFDGETDFLNQEQSTTIFRIFQETLTNVMRHAEATSVKIILRKDDRNFYLTVNDNGKGINQNQLNNSSSLGIIGMRERSQLLGGDVDIEGNEEMGTTVTIRIPMDETDN